VVSWNANKPTDWCHKPHLHYVPYRTSFLSRVYTRNFVTHKFNGYFYFSSYGWKALVSQDLLSEVPRSHSNTSHRARTLWTWSAHRRDLYRQHTQHSQQQTSTPQRDSNPQSKQSSGCRPLPATAWPLGSTGYFYTYVKVKLYLRLIKHIISFFFLSLDLCLPSHCRCGGLLLHLITITDTHTHTHTHTLGRIPLDEGSARRTHHTTFTRHKHPCLQWDSNLAIPGSERPRGSA
jgi:hypothetical protein